jgi:hypothetical protein
METQTIVIERHGTGDLTEKFKHEKLVDGENVIYQDASGKKLVALVSKGVVSDWIALDEDGTEAPTVTIRQPAVEPTIKGPKPNRPKAFFKVCACYATGDRCWWIREW